MTCYHQLRSQSGNTFCSSLSLGRRWNESVIIPRRCRIFLAISSPYVWPVENNKPEAI